MARMSIGRALGAAAQAGPDEIAVRCTTQTLTRRELDTTTNRMARAWADEGVGVDDVVAIQLDNGIDAVLATVATWKCGATPLPLSPRLPEHERAAIFGLTRPARVVSGPVDRHDTVSGDPVPDRVASAWKIVATSGSTGRPKAVRANAPATVDPDAPIAPFLPRSAVQLVAGPWWHAAPFTYAMRGLMTGHRLIILPRFDAGSWLDAVERHDVTWAMVVPTMMQRIAAHPARSDTDVAALDGIVHLGASCPPATKRAWLDWLGPNRVTEVYAGSESQGIAMITGEEWIARPGSVGRGIGGTVFRVVREDGVDCAPGEVGLIVMRRDREASTVLGRSVQDAGGWHTLGDDGWLDDEGWLYLAGRSADAVVSNGVTVHPDDVETVLEDHPSVRSVVVVGRPDRDRRERLHAIVECDGVTEAALRSWSLARLDPAQRPHTYHLTSRPLRDEAGKTRRARWRRSDP